VTFDEWHLKIRRGFSPWCKAPEYKDLRFGQAHMNELYKVKPKLCDSITGTKLDIFYTSKNYDEFVSYVSENWDKFE
jgi:hypothetical protein